MQIKNFTIYSLLVFLFFGLNSCSSDTNEIQETVITLSTANFTTTINENPANGELLGIVAGTTNEGSVSFSITEQTPNGAFAIDSNSGELTVANGAAFSFVNNPVITGIVKVANGNVSENATITINLNETIIIVTTSDFSVSIDENPTTGQLLGVVSGSTNQGNVTFSIEEQTPIGAFAIDSNSGELTVADETVFDFETNPTITGIVKVANGSVFENAAVSIELNDVNEENIFYGDVYLQTQMDVDSFGANNYTEVTGDLLITSCLNLPICDITNLNPLSSINAVGGILAIRGKNLINLDGLNIETVGRFVTIDQNEELENIDGLNSLLSSPEGVSVQSNKLLNNIDGFSNISNLTGFIIISSNDRLINIDGLSSVNSNIESISIAGNDYLSNIEVLSNISNVFEYISISNNDALMSLNGLHGLTTINGSLYIHSNSALSDFCDLQPLLISGGLGGVYSIAYNAYNPTQQNIINGDCSL